MYVDAVGSVVTASYYKASGGKSALIQVVSGDAVRIEAQTNAFALGWPSDLGPRAVGRRFIDLVASADFDGMIRLSDGSTVPVSGSSDLAFDADPDSSLINYMQIKSGPFVLTWMKNSFDSAGRHEVGFRAIDQAFGEHFVQELMNATATQGVISERESVYDELSELLAKYAA